MELDESAFNTHDRFSIPSQNWKLQIKSNAFVQSCQIPTKLHEQNPEHVRCSNVFTNMTCADLFLMILWLLFLNLLLYLSLFRLEHTWNPKFDVCFCPGLDGSKMFKVFIFTLLPGTQQLPGMVPRNASERSRISSAFCGSQKSIYSGIHNGEGFHELETWLPSCE